MSARRHAWVTGQAGMYRVRVSDEGKRGDYWGIDGAQFQRYRAAQDVANALHALIAQALEKASGAKPKPGPQYIATVASYGQLDVEFFATDNRAYRARLEEVESDHDAGNLDSYIHGDAKPD